MSMKKKAYLLMAAMMMQAAVTQEKKSGPRESREKPERKPNGKLFVIDGIEVYALNEKNAIRKAENIKATKLAEGGEKACPDCGAREWLYDDQGRRRGVCPCHY